MASAVEMHSGIASTVAIVEYTITPPAAYKHTHLTVIECVVENSITTHLIVQVYFKYTHARTQHSMVDNGIAAHKSAVANIR
eukprot:COSAG06_NODE_1629_length_8873_cov_6.041486_5_plen_82_part_00